MLTKLKNRKQEGFTIIEVLIVLAIAGLILLIVFLAVPALQRNSRNTQRQSDVASTASAAANFAGNNNGNLPTAVGNVTSSTTSISFICKGAAAGPTGTTQRSQTTDTPTSCPAANTNHEETRLGFYDPSSTVAGTGVVMNSAAGGAAGAITSVSPPGTACTMTVVTTACIVIKVGYTCNPTSATAAPVVSPRSMAFYYATEAGLGTQGNVNCTS